MVLRYNDGVASIEIYLIFEVLAQQTGPKRSNCSRTVRSLHLCPAGQAFLGWLFACHEPTVHHAIPGVKLESPLIPRVSP